MVKFCWSVVVMESAASRLALPVFGSYSLRFMKIMSRTLPPCTSLVFAGSSGFWGSPHHARTTPSFDPPALVSELLEPQAVAASATTAAPTTHLALLAPRMGLPPQESLSVRERKAA